MKFFKMIFQKLRILTIIRIKGTKNSIKIEGDLLKKSKIKVNGNNNTILIESGRYKNLRIGISGDNHTLIIKSSDHIGNLHIIMHNHTNTILIKENVSIGEAKIVSCGKNNLISIGRDCMFSGNIEIWGCDAHSILQDGKIINRSRPIEIGEHVWVGTGVKIMKGTIIGSGSVIGIGSLVTGKSYPGNVVIAGSPPVIIKENIEWTIENLEENF